MTAFMALGEHLMAYRSRRTDGDQQGHGEQVHGKGYTGVQVLHHTLGGDGVAESERADDAARNPPFPSRRTGFGITLLEETAWRNRSSPTTQPETRLSHHGVQVLGGTNIRNDGSKTGSSFTRHASPTNRSMAYRSFIELEFATAMSKAGPSYERCTHCGGQSSDVQVHGVASVQVTPGVAPAQREVASTTLPLHGLVRRPPLSWRTAEYSASSRDEAPTTPATPM